MEKRSLIIQPLPGIGDTVWFLPHYHAIADAYGPVTLLTKKRSHADSLLKHDPHIAQCLWLERNPGCHDGIIGFFRLILLLKSYNFSHVWILHKSQRYHYASIISGIPNRYFQGKIHTNLHPIEQAHLFLKNVGIDTQRPYKLYTSSQDTQKWQYRLQKYRRPFYGLCVSGSEMYKKWPTTSYTKLASILKDEDKGTIFIIGGKQEKEEVMSICHSVCSPHVVPIYDESLLSIVHFLPNIDFFVGNDTGILNMAAAHGVPSLGIFGATPALTYAPNLHCHIGQNGVDSISPNVLRNTLKKLEERYG